MTTKDEALKRAQEMLESMYEMMPNPSVGNAIEMCREALAQQDEQEPFAWNRVEFLESYDGERVEVRSWLSYEPEGPAKYREPLYKSPPKRKPLTDDEVSELSRSMVKGNKSVNWLCRAVEAAHGIGVEHDTP